jgi:hypothetical protein
MSDHIFLTTQWHNMTILLIVHVCVLQDYFITLINRHKTTHHPYTEASSYRYESFVDEVFRNDADTFCHVSLGCFDADFWMLWYFVCTFDAKAETTMALTRNETMARGPSMGTKGDVVLVGNLIGEDRVNYALVYNILMGISGFIGPDN